jgi:hypothetical protein
VIAGETAKEDLLVALVSWGEGCADPNFPVRFFAIASQAGGF